MALGLGTNERKIESLIILQDDVDNSFLRELIASLNRYEDSTKANVKINMSNGEKIISNKKGLKIPIKKILNSIDSEYFKDCYFNYFNSEIVDKLALFQSTDEELRDFLKFAKTLGCFSKNKLKDENGKETEVCIGQKACSLLAQFLKTKELGIRTVSWIF